MDPVVESESVLEDNIPVVHPDLDTDPNSPVDGNAADKGNVVAGDVDQAFEEVDLIVEESFEFPRTTPVCPPMSVVLPPAARQA